jgi:glycosyltransferase involved in cell wall biosynthesis
MGVSVYTYTYNVLSQGYPFLEAICSLLPIADEVVIVDVGSKDGTRELLETIEGRKVRVFDEEPWTNGKGGSNHRKTGSKCHDYCAYNTIAFVEADEVWQPELVEAVKQEIYKSHRIFNVSFGILKNHSLCIAFSRSVHRSCAMMGLIFSFRKVKTPKRRS